MSSGRIGLAISLSALVIVACSSSDAGSGADAICIAGECVPLSCTDTVLNGNETDLNCGGACAKCATAKTCKVGGDCLEGVCTPGTFVCAAPTKTDNVKNETETDIDCGSGPTGANNGAPACIDGRTCVGNTDCTSKHCVAGVCAAPTCTDGILNGTETDLDCGNDACPANKCFPSKKCPTAADCAEGVCTPGTLLCAAPVKDDGVKQWQRDRRRLRQVEGQRHQHRRTRLRREAHVPRQRRLQERRLLHQKPGRESSRQVCVRA